MPCPPGRRRPSRPRRMAGRATGGRRIAIAPGCPAARLPGCLPSCLPDCPVACAAARLPARLPGCLRGCPAACLAVRLPARLSGCLTASRRAPAAGPSRAFFLPYPASRIPTRLAPRRHAPGSRAGRLHARPLRSRGSPLDFHARECRRRQRHGRAVCASRTGAGCRTGNFVGAICRACRLTMDCVGTRCARGAARWPRRRRCAGTQQIMLRGWLKTVDSDGAGGPNRDKPHFGDA